MGILLYPYFLLAFWYRDFFREAIRISYSIFIYTANLLSVPLLFKTFFKPLKNEYREGLVLFSIIMGILVKSVILTIDLIILSALIVIIVFVNVMIFLLPILIVKSLVLFLDGSYLPPLLAITSLLIINELFLDNRGRARPKAKVSKNQQNYIDSLMFSARRKFEQNEESVKFFREKLGFGKIEASEVSGAAQKGSALAGDELLKQAAEVVLWVDGMYITNADLFAAYVLLSEDSTRFLQNNNLNNDDVMNILYWTRRKFMPDKFASESIRLLGPGVFDSLIYGWNYELKKYSRDLTWEVLSKKSPPSMIGREKEYDELIIALSKHTASNAIIIGEAGVGKKSLVEYLAYHSFMGEVPGSLTHRKVFELLVDKLLSGISNAGDLEARLAGVFSEITHSGGSIVFIQNIENIFGGGGFNFDMSGVLDEYLNSDKVKIIGTTTPSGFANFIEGKASSRDLFERIELAELSAGKTLLLMTEKAREVEIRYGLAIKYSALKQAVNLSSVYFPDRFSPGRDIDLLEDIASKLKIDKKRTIDGNDVIERVQSKTNVVLSSPDSKEKELLMKLEEKLHARIIGQEEAVHAVSDAMRRVRSGFKETSRPISVFLFLGPTGVGKTETAKALAREYFGSEASMIRLDMSEYQTQDQLGRLLGEKAGQEYVTGSLVAQVEKQPFSLVLLDEFEKAHPHLLDLFLQVFDEARLTDNKGKTVSFKNTIIIATSNAGTELLREKQNSGKALSKQELIDYLLKNNIFKPELINRFDEVIIFRFLNEDEIKRIAQILLSESLESLEDNQIKVSFDDKVVAKIAASAYEKEFGARNVRRYIEENIEGYLSKLILEDKIKKGDQVTLSVDESNNFSVL